LGNEWCFLLEVSGGRGVQIKLSLELICRAKEYLDVGRRNKGKDSLISLCYLVWTRQAHEGTVCSELLQAPVTPEPTAQAG